MIRRLREIDVDAYRDMRLEGLQSHPEMFDHNYDIEKIKSDDTLASELIRNEVYGEFTDDDILVGIIGFTIRPEPHLSHKGLIWGMYISPDQRGMGFGRKLMNHVIDLARGRVEIIQLAVVNTNSAWYLYESVGFTQYGVERRAVKFNDTYFDDIWMVLEL